MAKPRKGLPDELAGNVLGTPEPEDDRINSLKGELEVSEAGREELVRDKLALQNENERLEDQTKIRDDAIGRAAKALWMVPVVCLLVLVLTGTTWEIRSTDALGTETVVAFSMLLNPYAQTALIVSPIVFVGAILIALFKGVFREPQTDDDENGLSRRDMVALATIMNRMSGSGTT